MVASCDGRRHKSCGARDATRMRQARSRVPCGDVGLQSLPVRDLLGNAAQKCDYSKWECFATMNSSFAMGQLGGVLWEEGKRWTGEEEKETETVAVAGVRVADAKRGKTTRPFQSLPKSGWAGAGDRLEGGVARLLGLLPAAVSPGHSLSLSPSLTSLGCLGTSWPWQPAGGGESQAAHHLQTRLIQLPTNQTGYQLAAGPLNSYST